MRRSLELVNYYSKGCVQIDSSSQCLMFEKSETNSNHNEQRTTVQKYIFYYNKSNTVEKTKIEKVKRHGVQTYQATAGDL